MSVPCHVFQCPTCMSWRNITVHKICCGNELFNNAPNRDQLSAYLDKVKETEGKLVAKEIQIKRKDRAKAETRIIKVPINSKKGRQRLDRAIREQVLLRDEKKCVKCGSKIELHVHHKTPASEGGKDELENLETLCFICHMEMHRGEPIYNLMIKSLFKSL